LGGARKTGTCRPKKGASLNIENGPREGLRKGMTGTRAMNNDREGPDEKGEATEHRKNMVRWKLL